MKLGKWATGVALGAAGALAFTAPAAAQGQNEIVPDVITGDDGCTVTIVAAGELHVSSQTVTAGLAVRIGDVTEVHRGGLTNDGGVNQPFEVSVTVGPFDEGTTVKWLLFGGPERDDDQPAQADPVAVDAHLNSDGPDEYIEWYEIEVPGCPTDKGEDDEGKDDNKGGDEDNKGGEDDGEGGEQADDELPMTGSSTTLIAGGAIVLLAAGGVLFLLARRRRVSFTA